MCTTAGRASPLLAAFLLGALACSPPNACPTSIRAEAPPDSRSIQWGGTRPFFSASIVDVRVECIPHVTPHARRGSPPPAPGDYYALAVSASVETTVGDQPRYAEATRYDGLSATLLVEVISSNNVVIASTSQYGPIASAPRTQAISSTIDGLEREQIARAAVVRARWLFDR